VRYLLLSIMLLHLPLRAAELLLLSTSPAELYQAAHSNYHPVKIVQQVLKYYPAPYQVETVSLNRAFAGLRTKPGACVPVVRKSVERLRDFLFSEPFIIAPDIRLIVKADSRWIGRLNALQDKTGRISLARLLELPQAPVLVTEDGRTYGAALDPLLAGHRRANSVYVRTAKVSRYGETLPMLSKGFGDMALEYTIVLSAAQLAQFRVYRMQEADPFALAYFACARDAATRAILQQLDQAILTFRRQPQFQQLLLEPFPAAEHAQVWQVWQQMTAGQ